MTLNPVRTRTKPEYPTHRRRSNGLLAWARRAAAAGLASASLALGGCYGVSAYDEERLIDLDQEDDETVAELLDLPWIEIPPIDEDTTDMAGGMRAPGFECMAPPEYSDWRVPAYLDGQLCGEETAWASFTVDEAGPVRLTLGNAPYVAVALVGPDGQELAELGPDPSWNEVSVLVELEAATYQLAATAADPVGNPSAWFWVQIDRP